MTYFPLYHHHLHAARLPMFLLFPTASVCAVLCIREREMFQSFDGGSVLPSVSFVLSGRLLFRITASAYVCTVIPGYPSFLLHPLYSSPLFPEPFQTALSHRQSHGTESASSFTSASYGTTITSPVCLSHACTFKYSVS